MVALELLPGGERGRVADAVQEQHAVEVVELVLEGAGGEAQADLVVLGAGPAGLTAAYRLVQRHAMRAWDEELDLRELARGDAELAARVDLERVFTFEAYTQHVETIFERLRALVASREAGVFH